MTTNKSIRVTDFHVLPSIVFKCAFCQTLNQECQHDRHHVSTGGHCTQCYASYIIDWHDVPEQSTIEMTQSKEPTT